MTRFTAEERESLLLVARTAIVDGLQNDGSLERMLSTFVPTPKMLEPRGVFVTLKLHDRERPELPGTLRGCIGSMESERPLFRALADVARKSAFGDPRFPPLTESEWSGVRLSISVLTPYSRIDHPDRIVVGRDGVQLEKGRHRAVFLPQVAREQGWSTSRLLERLSLKAGLPADGWKGAELSTFRAEVFGDETP